MSTPSIFDNELTDMGRVEFRKDSLLLPCRVYSVRLGRLISNSSPNLRARVLEIFNLKRSRDLIHTITALYDVCLPNIGAQAVYDCIADPKAFTVVVMCDVDEPNESQFVSSSDAADQSEYESEDCLGTLMDEIENEEVPVFKNVFSDGSADDEDESESEEEGEDNTVGVRSYLKQNTASKQSTSSPRLRIIKNLVGCMTIKRELSFHLPGQEERVIDLELLSVRKKHRGLGVGKYLVNLAQNKSLIGTYDAVVTCADTDAVDFYEKHSFTADPLLNSRYADVGDTWTDATKMCYIPPYVSETGSFIDELALMERDFNRWQKLTLGAYQSQTKLFTKLKHEVFSLKAALCAKDGLIDELKVRNEVLERQNQLLRLKLKDFEDNEKLRDLVADLQDLQS